MNYIAQVESGYRYCSVIVKVDLIAPNPHILTRMECCVVMKLPEDKKKKLSIGEKWVMLKTLYS